MKKLVGFGILVLFITFAVNAQQGPKNQKMGNDFTPEQQAEIQTKKLTLALNLNSTQQSEVQALLLKNLSERDKTKQEMQLKKESGVAISSDEKYNMQIARLDKQIEQKAAMKNILSEEQFTQWEKMMQQKNKKQNSKKGNGQKGGQKNTATSPQQN
jgi:flagellar biosynthesis chaperone FliJ